MFKQCPGSLPADRMLDMNQARTRPRKLYYSNTRLNAACARFLTLTQRSNRPPRWTQSRCLETSPSSPNKDMNANLRAEKLPNQGIIGA